MNYDIEFREVEFISKTIESGILYVSERFNVAAHLCPCGCTSKVVTPLGPCEWSFYKENGKPTLDPSIGNWQIPCKSHYWITHGRIEWADLWTDKQIKIGRKKEQARRNAYYKKIKRTPKKPFWKRFINQGRRIKNI